MFFLRCFVSNTHTDAFPTHRMSKCAQYSKFSQNDAINRKKFQSATEERRYFVHLNFPTPPPPLPARAATPPPLLRPHLYYLLFCVDIQSSCWTRAGSSVCGKTPTEDVEGALRTRKTRVRFVEQDALMCFLFVGLRLPKKTPTSLVCSQLQNIIRYKRRACIDSWSLVLFAAHIITLNQHDGRWAEALARGGAAVADVEWSDQYFYITNVQSPV